MTALLLLLGGMLLMESLRTLATQARWLLVATPVEAQITGSPEPVMSTGFPTIELPFVYMAGSRLAASRAVAASPPLLGPEGCVASGPFPGWL